MSDVKKAWGALGRGDLLYFDPEDLVEVHDKKSALYDERIHLGLNEAHILNVMEVGVIEPIVVRKNGENDKGQPIVEVAAITDGQTAGQPLDRTASIALRFGDGSLGAVFCGRGIPDTQNNGTINGTHGRISLHDTLWEARQGRLEVVSDSVNLSESYEKNLLANYKAQVEAFNRGIQGGEEFDASGIDGLKVVQITSAIIESASTGRSVRVNELNL